MKYLPKEILILIFVFMSIITFGQKWDIAFASSSGVAPRDMIEFNGDFYVAGSWSSSLETFVAKWDGSSWSAVGSGFVESTGTTDGIYSIEVFNGEIYIGGLFTISIDGNSHKGFVKWNGTTWEAIDDFPTANFIHVYDLQEYNGNIMIGGQFGGAFGGSNAIDNVIGYNGTNWVEFDEGLTNGEVRSMGVHNSELYVAGKFTNDGNTNAFIDNFVKWDGVNNVWLNIGDFSTFYTNSGYIDQIQSFGNHLYVYTIRDDIFNNFPQLLRWDLASEIVNINTVSVNPEYSRLAFLHDMIVFNNNLIVAGNYRDSQSFGNSSPIQIESYDGTTWNKLLPEGASTTALGIYENKLITVDKILNDPSATIQTDKTDLCEGEDVTYSYEEVSTNPITGVSWTFEGGTPGTSAEDSPVVTYSVGGTYNVILEVTSSDGTSQILKQNAVLVNNDLSIDTQPDDLEICDYENAVFSVFASGDGVPISYQWQMNDGSGFVDLSDGSIEEGSSVSGSTNSVLTISRNGLSQNELNGNIFRCVISKCSSINSAEASLTVREAPIITENPVNFSVCESGDVTFSITATSNDEIGYQWQYRVAGTNTYLNLSDGGKYSGVETSILSISGADDSLSELFESDNSDGIVRADFKCIISSNSCEVEAFSNLYIHIPPTITEDPEDITVCNRGAGASVIFSTASSISLPGFSYQWQVNDGSGFINIENDDIYSGADTKDLVLTGAPSTFDGYQYQCAVGGCSNPVTSLAATLSIDDIPVITTQPVITSICEGRDTEFVVVATGNNLSYQWQVDIGPGGYEDLVNDSNFFASDGVLQISEATLNMHLYNFRCVITEGTCTVNSSAPQLRVYREPSISGAPADRTVCEGQITNFSRSASNFNGAVHTYQWQEAIPSLPDIFVDISDGERFSGTNSTNLVVSDPTVSMNGNLYRLSVKGCLSEIASESATLTVNQLPIIIESPTSKTVCTGEEVIFTAEATGTAVTYSWQRDTGSGFATITGFSSDPDLIFNATADMNGYKYKCIAVSASPCTSADAAESIEAILTVNEVEILSQPNSAIGCEGEEINFNISATGESLTYQWFENDIALIEQGVYSGVSSDNLVISEVTVDMNGNIYKCVVGGLCEDETSINANLQINSTMKPEIIINSTNASNPTLAVGNTSADSYEWFLDELSISTNSSIEATVEGSYTVVITLNNCVSEISDPYVYTILGTNNNEKMKVYPNPTSRFLRIDSKKDVSAFVFGLDGKMVIKTEVGSKGVIDLKGLDYGQYMIHLLEDGELIYSGKVIKQN